MNKIFRIYRFIVIFISMITLVLCLLNECPNGYKNIILIPIIYLILYIFCKPLHIYSEKYDGLLILNIIMFLKYIICTLIIVITKDFYQTSAYIRLINSSSNSLAIFLIIIEMISIFTCIFIFAPKIYNQNYKIKTNKEIYKENKYNILFILFFIIGIIFIILYPNNFFPKRLIYISQDDFELEATNGLITIVSYSFKLIICAFFINKCIVKYQQSKKKKYMIFSYFIILILCLLNTGRSRTLMLIPLLLFILITRNVFRKKDMVVLLLIVFSILSINLLAVSNYKYSWMNTSNRSKLFNIINIGTSIQEYTSNIRPIAAAVETNKLFGDKIGIKLIINDTFGSIPIINHYIEKNNRYNNYYNYFVFNSTNQTTKIAPLIGYSLAYFGYIGCFILPFLFTLLLMYFENKISIKEITFLKRYIYYYMLYVFAFSICSSYQSVIGRLFVYCLPVILIDYLLSYKLYVKKNGVE